MILVCLLASLVSFANKLYVRSAQSLPSSLPTLCLFILVLLCMNTIASPFQERVPLLASFPDKAGAAVQGKLWSPRALYGHLFFTTLLIFNYVILICASLIVIVVRVRLCTIGNIFH